MLTANLATKHLDVLGAMIKESAEVSRLPTVSSLTLANLDLNPSFLPTTSTAGSTEVRSLEECSLSLESSFC